MNVPEQEIEIPPYLLSRLEDLATDLSLLSELMRAIAGVVGES